VSILRQLRSYNLKCILKQRREISIECQCFREGVKDVVPYLGMFSWKELNILISGSDKPIDLTDWRRNTNYGVEFNDEHPTIKLFWEVRKIPKKSRKFVHTKCCFVGAGKL